MTAGESLPPAVIGYANRPSLCRESHHNGSCDARLYEAAGTERTMSNERKYRNVRTLAITLSAAAALAAPLTAAAAAAGPARPAAVSTPLTSSAVAGYLWWNGTSVESDYAYNSVDPGGFSVTPVTTGVYTVDFGGMASITFGAVVQVTSFEAATTCTAGGWGSSAGFLQATIYCYSISTGTLSNSDFTVLVTHVTSKPLGTLDYSLVYKSSASGNLSTYQYNSAGKKNSVKHLGTGNYQVTLGGPKTSGRTGAVKVTAYGSGPGSCDPVRWGGSSRGEVVNVRCFGFAKTAENREFVLTYAATNNLMGLNKRTDVNVFATGSRTVYQPQLQYDSHHGARATVAHLAAGEYLVLAAGSQGTASYGGDVQVSAVGSAGIYCDSDGWDQQFTPELYVNCYQSDGGPANSSFTLQWVVP
jgi:hypothetical protein